MENGLFFVNNNKNIVEITIHNDGVKNALSQIGFVYIYGKYAGL